MKVLGLCSGRKNGNTEIMMKEVFMAIEEKMPEAAYACCRCYHRIKPCLSCLN